MPEGSTEIIIPHKPRFDKASLIDQSFPKTLVGDFSLGSTNIEHERSMQEARDNKGFPLKFPDINSYNVSEMFFYRVDDLPFNFLGVDFDFDAYLGNLKPKSVVKNSTTPQIFKAYIPILEHLQRLQTSANIDKESMEAFSVMLNVARNKGKIAAVLAHGTTIKKPDSDKYELRIFTDQGYVNANDVISDLAKQKDSSGNPKYNLIYFNACNEDNAAIDMGNIEKPVNVPVITYTDVNKGILSKPGKLKVNWPPTNSSSSLLEKLLGSLKKN